MGNNKGKDQVERERERKRPAAWRSVALNPSGRPGTLTGALSQPRPYGTVRLAYCTDHGLPAMFQGRRVEGANSRVSTGNHRQKHLPI